MRSVPKIELSACPPTYARLVGQGWDSVQEAFDVQVSDALVEMLERAQLEAREADAMGEGLAPLRLRDVDYRMRSRGTRGSRWVLECADWLVMIAAPGTHWPVSIRYLSHAIWREGGVDGLREQALLSFKGHFSIVTADHVRLSRA